MDRHAGTQVLLLSLRLRWRQAVRVKGLPGIDEILGQADVSGGPCDGDLALRRALHGIGNFNLCPGHLSNLIYFGSLTANNATY